MMLVAAMTIVVAALTGVGAVAAARLPSATAPRVVVEPPIDSPAEAHAAVVVLGTPFANFAPIDRALIGANATYEVKGAEGGEAVWIVVYTYGWGDCQAGCIDRHSWAFQVDGASGAARYDSQMGPTLPTDAPDALRAVDESGGGTIPTSWMPSGEPTPIATEVPSGTGEPGTSIDPSDYEELYAQFLAELKATLTPCAEGVDTEDPTIAPCIRPDGSIAGAIPVFSPAPHASGNGWIDALPALILATLVAWSGAAAIVGLRRSRT